MLREKKNENEYFKKNSEFYHFVNYFLKKPDNQQNPLGKKLEDDKGINHNSFVLSQYAIILYTISFFEEKKISIKIN